ncbi:MAG: hypothetical protein MET45_09720 [Nostoc sp. LLA-1]|nr:hypothetical protein [Cyanocohniella sp. LLY]
MFSSALGIPPVKNKLLKEFANVRDETRKRLDALKSYVKQLFWPNYH